MTENIETRESAPWTECEACGLLDHPGMTCDEAAAACTAPMTPDVPDATADTGGRMTPSLTEAQLAVIRMALEDAIAYREPDNNCCPACGEQDQLCEEHSADQDHAAEYREVADQLELTALRTG
jgi:hypothetical protein